MTIQYKGPWDAAGVNTFLRENLIPLRLSCVGADGYPRVVSLWFAWSGGRFVCASHASSQLVQLLQANHRVGFEVSPNEPPYCGVRGQGDASIQAEGAGETLEQLIERYLGSEHPDLKNWLLSRHADERLITVTPLRFFSWDYRARMSA